MCRHRGAEPLVEKGAGARAKTSGQTEKSKGELLPKKGQLMARRETVIVRTGIEATTSLRKNRKPSRGRGEPAEKNGLPSNRGEGRKVDKRTSLGGETRGKSLEWAEQEGRRHVFSGWESKNRCRKKGGGCQEKRRSGEKGKREKQQKTEEEEI